ncbi:hypothetical protein ZWY2020_020224 [Hordeum vulgare]|nr:hypothetical protein ZWY2020_020224 [Hordeum vulgare]
MYDHSSHPRLPPILTLKKAKRKKDPRPGAHVPHACRHPHLPYPSFPIPSLSPLHRIFFWLSLMHHDHLIPRDAARVPVSHGALASIVVTPTYAARLRPAVESSSLPVRLVEVPLNLAGTDDVGQIPLDEEAAYLLATSRLRDPLEWHLRAHAPPATCIVSRGLVSSACLPTASCACGRSTMRRPCTTPPPPWTPTGTSCPRSRSR